jgi:hypothetical protein
MSDVKALLTFYQARALAYQEAKKILTPLLSNPSIPLFEEFFLEEEGSWMFFRNRAIVIPPEYSLGGDCTYVVSRHGEIRLFYDFFYDLDKAKEHHKKLSDYFLAKGL